jgi:hypothetical protein
MNDKNAADPTLIRRLRAAGCPMPGDCEDDPMPDLTIAVLPAGTRAYVMRSWVEYVLAVRFANHSYAPLEVRRLRCRFPWRTQLVGPMDPRIRRPGKQAYRLPGSGREFPYERVLNPRTGRAGSINPGDSLECIILAFRRCQRFPDECFAGPVIPAELAFVDQHGRKHFSRIEVGVDRTAIINSLRLAGCQGRGLYDTSESQASVAVREQARRSMAAEISSDIPAKRVIPRLPRYQEIPNRRFERHTENLRP